MTLVIQLNTQHPTLSQSAFVTIAFWLKVTSALPIVTQVIAILVVKHLPPDKGGKVLVVNWSQLARLQRKLFDNTEAAKLWFTRNVD